ncbi:Protein-tyrosine-phosphatase [Purpureocillium takamizusanense]|uniref:Protein-tyrosine-phosphatase n=1 Tax=Purpureocillium takamizusanense TaxID=2060973 RepID=A0A9Q8QGD5_9HYPO|nr:Protein-tyrosine-phosphatase [Purpureocillium takamizusanense]UNI19140.1 Protein-tyrosine-phosphatase [Purpureocillium takamizusanense]
MADPSPVLDKVLNFRDVGKTVNFYLGEKRVREGVIFRSARPDDATPRDKAIIKDQLAIRTVIDLRTKTELLEQAQKHHAQGHGAEACSSRGGGGTAPVHPPRIAGIDYREIKITGRSFERHIMSQLCWWSFIKVIFLYVFGYRLDAVRIIGQEVLLARGLIGLGTDTLDHSGAEIREALLLYGSAQSVPVLVHCTQGKDRTGIICALLLMILEVPAPAIEHDYFLTDAALISERDERLAEIRNIGLTDEWFNTAEDMISGMEKHLAQTYGGLDAYLDGIGFGQQDRDRLREQLLY